MSFPASKKLKILNKVLKEGKTVSKVCREAGIARKTFYQWKKRYQQAPPRIKKQALELNYASGKHHPKNKRYKFEDRVISIIVSHPSWGSRKIAAILCKHRQRISNHAVYSLLEDLNLETKEKREEFSSLYQTFARIEKIYQPKPLRLTPEVRKRVVEEVVIGKEAVSQVCQKYRLSRKTFYKWLARYQEARVKEAVLLQAMEDGYVEGFAHPRSISEKVQEEILYLVRQHPEYSTHKVAQILAEVGNHGVQNVFQRLNLNTYEKRLAYAQAYQPVTIPVPGILERLKPLIGRIPIISAIPPPKAEVFRRAGPPFVFSFLSSILLSTIIIYWLGIVSQAPTFGAKLGLLSATIALFVGSIFFAYSMKYYLTLAIVLSFSRQAGEGIGIGLAGEIKKNGNGGWLGRIFGINGGNGPTSPEASSFAKASEDKSWGLVQAGGLQPSLEHIQLKRYPFISIHLPFYNERKVAERILKACTSMDYPASPDASQGGPNYEIIVCDDSTDETTTIVQRFADQWNKQINTNNTNRPMIKVLHRSTREGFKGGALGEALKHTDSRAEFIVVFDADFIPYPDTLTLFIKYFQASAGTTDFRKADMRIQTNKKRMNANERIDPRIAVVAGYQWHVLNKSENWITRGVRTEYAGSYVIERPGQEILGAMKLIHGSVYAIRADILKKFGWGTSITEDFELTLRLYAQGYKVVYTPYIQAPAECASTLKRLIRQRMRWAEGHSHNVRRRFAQILTSPKMTLMEKFEFLYLSPYYLQAFFFLVGTFSWLMAETVFRARLPFWTSLWGWSLVLTNLLSLPLVNAVGLFLEEAEEKDYIGILSFVALSYLLVPFQAYASVKGFIEKEEGPWFRTPKTGKITDIFTRGRFYRWISGILPGRRVAPAAAGISLERSDLSGGRTSLGFLNPYLSLATANNQFNNFSIKPRRIKWIGKVALVFLLIISLTIYSLSGTIVKPVQAAISGTGDGSDGAITISASTDCQTTDISTDDGDSTADCIATYVSSTSSSGQTTLNVNSTTGFYANDDIFIVTILGTNPAQGTYEFRTIQSVGASSFTLTENLTNTYTYSSDVDETMVVRVPQYTDVTINSGGTLLVSAYSTTANTGGILVFKASGTVTVNSGGSISVASKGFGGGSAQSGGAGGTGGGAGSGGSAGATGSGSGSGGGGGTGGSPGGGNATKGGGGAGGTGGGGGGGAYGATGNAGTAGTAGEGGDGGDGGANNGGAGSAGSGGTAGSSYGVANLSTISFGSGGGSGASGAGGGAGDTTGGIGGTGGAGGGGGGMVFLWAQTITVSGSISANGANGGIGISGGGGGTAREEAGQDAAAGGGAPGGGGGGGAGGSVFIRGGSVTLGANLVTATGGTSGSGGAAGGAGGAFYAFFPINNKGGGASSAGAGGGGATDSNLGKAATGGSAGSGGGGTVGRIHVEYETKDSFATNPAADELLIPEKLLIFVPLAIFLPKIAEWLQERRRRSQKLLLYNVNVDERLYLRQNKHWSKLFSRSPPG